MIDLNDVTYAEGHKILNGYELRYAWNLNGSSEIEMENDCAEIPANVFEIPLEETALDECDGTRFILSTSRGVYTLELLDDRWTLSLVD